jgi:hypothetical protein
MWRRTLAPPSEVRVGYARRQVFGLTGRRFCVPLILLVVASRLVGASAW